MRYWLETDMRPVEIAREACRQTGIEPHGTPVRGGTDGSRLTEMGVPCPNLFTGMQMIHGPLEWISVQDMAAATRVCLRLAELWGQEKSRDRGHRAASGEKRARRRRPGCRSAARRGWNRSPHRPGAYRLADSRPPSPTPMKRAIHLTP